MCWYFQVLYYQYSNTMGHFLVMPTLNNIFSWFGKFERGTQGRRVSLWLMLINTCIGKFIIPPQFLFVNSLIVILSSSHCLRRNPPNVSTPRVTHNVWKAGGGGFYHEHCFRRKHARLQEKLFLSCFGMAGLAWAPSWARESFLLGVDKHLNLCHYKNFDIPHEKRIFRMRRVESHHILFLKNCHYFGKDGKRLILEMSHNSHRV